MGSCACSLPKEQSHSNTTHQTNVSSTNSNHLSSDLGDGGKCIKNIIFVPLFCNTTHKQLLQIHRQHKTKINEKMIESINKIMTDYYCCWCLRNLFPKDVYNQYPIYQIEPIIAMFLMNICPDGILPTLQFNSKEVECLDLTTKIEPVDCHSVDVLLHNYPQQNYRIFYKPMDEFLKRYKWKYQDIDEHKHFYTEFSYTNDHLSIQSDWTSPGYLRKPNATIKRLKSNTSYQLCIAPKFTNKLKKHSAINTEDEKKRMNYYGFASEIIYFKTPNWHFDAGTIAMRTPSVLFKHQYTETDTVGSSRGYDKGIHEFKIEFIDDMTNEGTHYCAFGIVSNHCFNNAKSDTHWISEHDKNYYYLTEYGYLCRKDNVVDDFMDIGIKWRDEQEMERVILTMVLDLDNWRLSYIIGQTKIDSISIQEDMTYYPCVSGRKGNFSVKILSE